MNENDLISNNLELTAIMEKHNIGRDRFVRGVIFAEYVVNGESANNAYVYSFECTKEEARTKSANFRNSKWVQDLIVYFKPDENTLYFGEKRQVIRRLMRIIDSGYSEEKDIISAANALAKYIKQPTQSKLEQDDLASDASKLMMGLIDGISKLSNQDKMISSSGEIIDIEVIQ